MNRRAYPLLAAALLLLAACGAKTNPAGGTASAGSAAKPQDQSAQDQSATQAPSSGTQAAAQTPGTDGSATRQLLLSGGFEVPRQAVSATDFTLADLSGRKVSLSSFKGKLVVLSFWATWCGPCKAEIPSVEALYQKLASRGFTVVAVDVAEKSQDVAAFVKSYKMTFPVLLDPDGSTAGIYGADAIPTNYIVGRDGQILGRVKGYDGKEWTSPEKVDLFDKLLKL